MSTPCASIGRLDTYGLGIRISFYLFWYSIPLSLWVARSETKLVRLIHSLLIAATFLGLIIQVDKDELRHVEIYITLLLVFGGYLYYVPLYIWRLLTCCQIPFDPSRYIRVQAGPIFVLLNFFLLVSITIFKLWFWFEVAGNATTTSAFGFGPVACQEYGFFFSRVRLDQRGFVVGNILLTFCILGGCVVVAVLTIVKMARGGWLREVVDDDGRSISVASSEYDEIVDVGKLRETALQEFDIFLYLITVSTVLAAIELTISWNQIKGVNTISSPAQTIPLILGTGAVVRVVYIALLGDLDERYRIKKGKAPYVLGDLGNFGAWFGVRRTETRVRSERGASVYSHRTRE